jgi:hypothetical protein
LKRCSIRPSHCVRATPAAAIKIVLTITLSVWKRAPALAIKPGPWVATTMPISA